MRAARTTTRCQPNGPRCLVAYRGPSTFDGTTIRAALYSLHGGSRNQKIGRMAQVLIAPDDQPPHHAVRSGRDAAVCGACPLRPSAEGGCYVVTPLCLPEVWRRTNGLEANLDAACDALRKSGLPLRFGSWGDPAAVPFEVLDHLAHATADDDGVPRITAYTSAWRTCDPRLRDLAMASVLSEHERAEAKSMGWRTFRVRTPSMPVLPGELVCPATPEGGKRTTCSKCLLCRGATAPVDVTVMAHGSVNKIGAMHALIAERALVRPATTATRAPTTTAPDDDDPASWVRIDDCNDHSETDDSSHTQTPPEALTTKHVAPATPNHMKEMSR